MAPSTPRPLPSSATRHGPPACPSPASGSCCAAPCSASHSGERAPLAAPVRNSTSSTMIRPPIETTVNNGPSLPAATGRRRERFAACEVAALHPRQLAEAAIRPTRREGRNAQGAAAAHGKARLGQPVQPEPSRPVEDAPSPQRSFLEAATHGRRAESSTRRETTVLPPSLVTYRRAVLREMLVFCAISDAF